MITTPTNFTPLSTNVRAIKYPYTYVAQTSSPVTFSPKTAIPDAQRAKYGYAAGNPFIKAIEIRVINFSLECPIASAANQLIGIAVASSSPGFTALGSRPYNTLAPLLRTIGSVTSTQQLITPASIMYVLDTPGEYTGYSFTISVVNLVTGVAISTTDYMSFDLEVIEYLCQ